MAHRFLKFLQLSDLYCLCMLFFIFLFILFSSNVGYNNVLTQFLCLAGNIVVPPNLFMKKWGLHSATVENHAKIEVFLRNCCRD